MLETLTSLSNVPDATLEWVGAWTAALLTIAVLSHILGNNLIFRVAEYLFVGVAAGYAGGIAWTSVLWPRLQLLLSDPAGYWYYGVFFVLGLMLLTRGISAIAVLGNLPLGLLFGAGAALALGGALTGTLVPQMRVAVVSVSPEDYGGGLLGWAYALDALLLVSGTLAVLAAFHFGVRGRGRLNALWYGLLNAFGKFGRALIMVTFGALFAGAALTFFTLLVSRLFFLANWVSRIAAAWGGGA
ncbi:MAG: hypothetical protein ACYC5M_13180 [Anaerolineae bacterium]